MKRLDFRTVFVVLLAAAVGCKGDPTADLRTGVNSLSLIPDMMFMDPGESEPFEVVVRDQQLNPVAAAVEVASLDEAIVTVEVDSAIPSADNARHNFIVTAVAAGQGRLVATAAGVSDTAVINVLPLAFNGTVSDATPAGGENIVIRSTADLKFNPASSTVTIGGLDAPVFSASADSLVVVTPFGASGPATITDVVVTFIPGLETDLNSTFTVTQTGDAWTGDDAVATAPTIPLPAAGGQTVFITDVTTVANSASCPEVVLGFGSTGPCMIFRFDLAADTELNFLMDWDSDADLDFYVCPDADPNNCFEDGGGGATGDHPEDTGATFTAGTHYLFVEIYDGAHPTNIIVTIARP